ncbi:MAG: hypothetical protein GX369_06075 [Euryarchaeota archaeon]|nr:hypothetical protein [Euryarchaeota archaeon]
MSAHTKVEVGDLESKIAEALEPAPVVWPPATRDRTPVGKEAAEEFLKERVMYESLEGLSGLTVSPEYYIEETVAPRLLDVIARLPKDVFDILSSDKRNVRFHVRPILSRSSPPIAEVRPSGPGNNRTYVVFLRGALELDDEMLRAVVVHELCHVILDHRAPIAWPRDPYELKKVTSEMENEALHLGDEIGFREETWMLRELILDMALERGEEGHILSSGDVRGPN